MSIDWDKFKETFQYFDREVIAQVIDIFDAEFTERFEKMEKSLNMGNMEDLRFQAHSFKGVVSSFMATDAFTLAKKLEDLAKNGDTPDLSHTYHQLYDAAVTLRDDLNAFKQTLL